MILCYTDLDLDIIVLHPCIGILRPGGCDYPFYQGCGSFFIFHFSFFIIFLNCICSHLLALRAPAFPALPLALRPVSNMIPTHFMPKSSYACGDCSLNLFLI